MKRIRTVMASEQTDWEVSVSFNGFIGSEKIYSVSADDEDGALLAAEESAKEDLEVTDCINIEDDEWEVTVNFDGLIGIEETYTVYADDEDEAYVAAIEEAADDLEAELVEEDYEDDGFDDYEE